MRLALLAGLVVAFMAAMTSQAWATLEVQNYTDPAGDPTTFTYQLLGGDGRVLGSDTLGDGGKRSFGPNPAVYGSTYTFQVVLPAGWQVASIQCLNKPGSATFAYDPANGRVTISGHAATDDQYCAFTNRRIGASPVGGGAAATGPSTGVAPTLPGSGPSTPSKGPALLRVKGGLRFATATVSLPRRSVIKGQLLYGKRVVGTTRITRNAGTRSIKVSLSSKWRRTFQHQGRKRVTLTLKIVVVGSNKATKVFRYRVIVRV